MRPDVARWIGLIHHCTRKYMSDALAPHGMPAWAGPMLMRIIHGDPPSQDDLTRESHKDKSHVSRILAQLEEQGLVTREADPNDSRVKRVLPTAQGRAMGPIIIGLLRAWNEALLDGIDDEECAIAEGVLQRMAENAARRAGMDLRPACGPLGPPNQGCEGSTEGGARQGRDRDGRSE